MNPILIWELLDTIFTNRVYESQSLDSCPDRENYFITVNMEESTIANGAIAKGPRTMTIAVHRNAEIDRDYGPITDILNLIDGVLLPIDDMDGSDGVRVSQVRRQGRSGNLLDEGWNTITRTATYGVLYNEYAT